MADVHEKPQHGPAVTVNTDVEERMSITRYFMTRIPTLVPPMNPAPNPFSSLLLLNGQQWLFFLVCLYSPLCKPQTLMSM